MGGRLQPLRKVAEGKERKFSARSVRVANFLVPSEGVHHSPTLSPPPPLLVDFLQFYGLMSLTAVNETQRVKKYIKQRGK